MCTHVESSEQLTLPLLVETFSLNTPTPSHLDIGSGTVAAYPKSLSPIIIEVSGKRGLKLAGWGFLRELAEKGKRKLKTIANARSETVSTSPAFADAFGRRRCLIPVSSFFEVSEGRHIRFFDPDSPVLALAGLWEPPGKHADVITYTVITVPPNATIAGIHDRMPATIARRDFDLWLGENTPEDLLLGLLRPCRDDMLIGEDAGPTKKPKEDGQSSLDLGG